MADNDLAASLVGFARALRAAGVPANPGRALASVDALTAFSATGTGQLYWATRLSFCAQRSDIPVFDSVFQAWFGLSRPDTGGPPARRAGAGLAPVEAVDDSPHEEAVDRGAAAGAAEVLRAQDIRKLSPAERAEINRFVARLAFRPAQRRSLRYVPGGSSRIDVDRTIRATFQRGGEPAQLCRRRHSLEPRRLLLLVDVSGSMASYSDTFLRFGHAAIRARGTAAEVFTLGTRFARATTALREADPDLAMRAAAGIDPARGSGTKLGPALHDFLRQWSGHRAVRSATVVIASDGWEAGQPDLLERQIARLKLLGRWLIWVNPQAGAAGFKPAAPGLRRVLPLVDEHVAGHSFAALRSLADRIMADHDD